MIERRQPYGRQLHVCINDRSGAFGPNPDDLAGRAWLMKVSKEDVPQAVENN